MSADEKRRAWLRRLAPLLLLVAALVVFRFVAPKLPRDHDVVYELGEQAPDVIRLDVAWSRPDEAEKMPTFSVSFRFSKGKAPRRLSSTVRLPDGSWDVSARIERAALPPEEVSRRVTLGEGTTVIRLDDSR